MKGKSKESPEGVRQRLLPMTLPSECVSLSGPGFEDI
jgi:hypothetical protein